MDIDENVQKTFTLLLSKWKTIILLAIAGVLCAYFITANFTTQNYTSSVTFFASAVDTATEINETEASSGSELISNTSKMNYAMKMISTYVEIFKTNEFCSDVADSMNKRLGTNYSRSVVAKSMTVAQTEETTVFVVTITTADPELSYQIATELCDKIPERMKNINYGLLKATVEDPPVKALKSTRLNYIKNSIIGAIVGIILACAIVILRDLIDIRIKSPDDLAQKYDIPILAAIPDYGEKKTHKNENNKGVKKNG